MQEVVVQLLNGLVWGLIFALIALGLTLIFGHLNVINMAHGSLYMLGAVFSWYLTSLLGSFWVSLLLAPLAVAAIGLVLNQAVLTRVVGRKPELGVLATAGVLLIVQNAVLGLFGGAPRPVAQPVSGSVALVGVTYPSYRLLVAGISIAAMFALALFQSKTRIGMWMRAVPQAPELAAAIGMPTARVNATTVVLGAYLAGLAGVLAAPIVSVDFQMGVAILAASFIVVVVGGLGSLAGAVVVALILGIARGAFILVVAPGWAEAFSLLVLLPILVLRPTGIFGGRQ